MRMGRRRRTGWQEKRIRRKGSRKGMVAGHKDVGCAGKVRDGWGMSHALQVVGLVVIIGQVVKNVAWIWQGSIVGIGAGSVSGGVVWSRGHKNAEASGHRKTENCL